MLSAAEIGLDAVTPHSDESGGPLRASLPAFVTQTPMMDTIEELAAFYPKVTLNLDFSDHQRDLIGEGFDVGVRIGTLKDSQLLGRILGYLARRLVVSKDDDAHHDTPTHPKDLEKWEWVQFSARSDTFKVTNKDGQTFAIKGNSSKTTVNSADAKHQLVSRGFGISPLPENTANESIESGKLVELLPDWTLEKLGLYAFWPARSDRENLRRLFVNFLASGASKQDAFKDRLFPSRS